MNLKQNKNILIAWILLWHGNKGSIFQRLEIWTIQGHFCLKQLTLTTTARGGGVVSENPIAQIILDFISA